MLGIKVIDNQITGGTQVLPSNYLEGKKINGLLLLRPYSEVIQEGYNSEIHNLLEVIYTITDDNVVGTRNIVQKDLVAVKDNKISLFKKNASKELQNTDWKAIRHLDQTGLGITPSLTPEQYTTLLQNRQGLRDKSNNLEMQINACTTNEETLLINW